MSKRISVTSRIFLAVLLCGGLSACSGGPSVAPSTATDDRVFSGQDRNQVSASGTTIWDAFRRPTSEVDIDVNKYLWAASLEVLNFLPIETVDPFSGVIITGFGTPPGGSRAYRATVLIDDPALNARSLNVSLQTRNAPADAATVRAVEDAILTRARQLRIADDRL